MIRHHFPVAVLIRCKCCNADLDADDFHPEMFHHARSIEAAHGGDVCTDCMDAHQICAGSGDLILPGCGVVGPSGEIYASQRVLDDCLRADADDADLLRLCAGWR